MKLVKRDTKFEGAITNATNYALEAESIGIPLWLQRNGHPEQSTDCMAFLGRQNDDLFVRHSHRQLQKAYAELTRKRLSPTDGLIQAELMALGCWSDTEHGKDVIGLDTLYDLSEKGSCKLRLKMGDTGLELLRELVEELLELRWKRRIVHESEELNHVVQHYDGQQFDDGVCDCLARLQIEYVGRSSEDAAPLPIGHLFKQDVAEIERQLSGEYEPRRIFSGFNQLDQLSGGFLGGNLIVLAGRTGMGKTSLALDVAWKAARDNNLVIYFTLEMSTQEIVRRIASKATRMNVLRMRYGDLADFQLDIYRRQANETGIPLFIDDRPATPTDIEHRCERVVQQLGGNVSLDLIVADHLQLCGVKDLRNHENRNRQLAQYTAELKTLAKRLNCSILALSQVNRASEKDQRPPRLSDLRESGSIEENGDVVLGIYRKHVDVETAPKDEAKLVILKNRSGPTGTLDLKWMPALAKFTNPDAPMEDTQEELGCTLLRCNCEKRKERRMSKFEMSLKDGHLIVDVDLVACDFTAVDKVSVFPTDENLMEEDPESVGDVRFVVDVSGSMKPIE